MNRRDPTLRSPAQISINKFEWDRIPTDPSKRQVTVGAMKKKTQVFFGVRSGTVLLEISWTYITNNPWWYQLIFLEIGRYRICQWQRLCLFSAIIWKANRNIQIQTGQICLKSPFRNSMQHVEESTVWKVGIYRFPEAPQFHRWTDFQEIRIPPKKKHQHFKVDFSANFVRLFFWGGDIMISTSKPTTVKTLSLQRHIVQRCTSLGNLFATQIFRQTFTSL